MDIFGGVKEAVTAGAGVAATGGVSSFVLGQSWLVPVLQVAVSIVFIVKSIDRRQARLHAAVNETRGEVEVLEGQIAALRKALPCLQVSACHTPAPIALVVEK